MVQEQLQITGGSVQTWLAFDGSKTTDTYSLPAGSYTASLITLMGVDAGASFLLNRRASDGTTSIVTATLVDTNAFTFDILQGQVTPLTMHFTVPGLGDLTFSTGTLSVGASVAQVNGGGSARRSRPLRRSPRSCYTAATR
jgi:hypothetical protein